MAAGTIIIEKTSGSNRFLLFLHVCRESRILKQSEAFGKTEIPESKIYQAKRSARAGKLLRKLKRSTHFVAGGNAGSNGDLEKVLFDYVNYTFHLDLIEFNTVIRELAAHMKDLEATYRCGGDTGMCHGSGFFPDTVGGKLVCSGTENGRSGFSVL